MFMQQRSGEGKSHFFDLFEVQTVFSITDIVEKVKTLATAKKKESCWQIASFIAQIASTAIIILFAGS